MSERSSRCETPSASPATVDVLDAVRRKRNQISYEHAGTTSDREAEEFHKTVQSLRAEVVGWLTKRHPALLPPGVRLDDDE